MNNDGTSTSPTDALAVAQENTPVCVSSAPSKELVVRDGQVILPETRCVAPADKEFEELVLIHAIPRDELPELLDALHGKRSAYSPVMKLLFLVGFAVIGGLVYFFRPRPPELIDSSSVLVIDTQTPSKVSKEFSALLKQANEAFDKGRYAEVKEMIAPKMEELLRDKESFCANARLASIFFSAHQKTGFPRSTSGFDKWIDDACRFDPDNLEWQIYRICLGWKPFQAIYKTEYRVEAVLNNENRIQQVKMACMRAKTKIDRLRMLNANKPAESRLTESTVTTLDMIECQVLITKWRMDGGKSLPDDKGAPGVEFREMAYSLASKHENDIAFLDVKLYIAEKVREGLVSGIHGYYYFNGETNWKLDPLDNAINDIKLKKQKLSQNK